MDYSFTVIDYMKERIRRLNLPFINYFQVSKFFPFPFMHYIYFDIDNYADDCNTNDNDYNNDSKYNHTSENNYNRSL